MKKLLPFARVLLLLGALLCATWTHFARALEAPLLAATDTFTRPVWGLAVRAPRGVGELGVNGVPFRFGLAESPLDPTTSLDAFERSERASGGRCLRLAATKRPVSVCLTPPGDLSDALLAALRSGDTGALGPLRATFATRDGTRTRLILVEAARLPLRELLEGPTTSPSLEGLPAGRTVLFVTDRSRGREEPLLVVQDQHDSAPESEKTRFETLPASGERWLRTRSQRGFSFWLRLAPGAVVER